MHLISQKQLMKILPKNTHPPAQKSENALLFRKNAAPLFSKPETKRKKRLQNSAKSCTIKRTPQKDRRCSMEQTKAPLFTRRDLIRLIIPLVIEQILGVTIGMADSVMVSSVGEAAVSGVSLVDSLNILFINISCYI